MSTGLLDQLPNYDWKLTMSPWPLFTFSKMKEKWLNQSETTKC